MNDVLRHVGRPARRLREALIHRLVPPVLHPGHEPCPIGWQPSVFTPVFYGFQDLEVFLPDEPVVVAGAAAAKAHHELPPHGPGKEARLRVFYPSLDGSPQDAPILAGCSPYPVVVFAHGHCSADDEHWKKWFELPATLARCGYVVLVPELPATGGGTPPGSNEAEQDLIDDLADWARSGWEHGGLVMPAPATALVGHSFGGGLTARVAARSPGRYAAHAGLSAVEYTGDLVRSGLPKLLFWGDDLTLEVLTVPMSSWEDQFTAPTHVVEVLGGGHWDYLPPGRSACEHGTADGRGPCGLVPFLAADIVACFLTRYLPPPDLPEISLPWPFGSIPFLFTIHPSLRPPVLILSDEQKFFAGGHLSAWQLVEGRDECGLRLGWKTASSSGSLTHD